MLEGVLNMPAFRLHLTMFCVIITNVWWDILNSYMDWLPLNIPEKLHWQHLFRKPEEAETHCLYLSWYNTTHPEEHHLSFKQMGTTTIFSFGFQACVWSRSDPIFWQNPCSGCNSGIDLVVALKLFSFNFVSMSNKFVR